MNDELASALMTQYADSTGLSGQSPLHRYLWTDAFAVCNYLGLYRRTGRSMFLSFARELIDQVHHVLGRHRPDDSRRGWISGLSDIEGELHPTCGGLRIGKSLNERPADEPLNQRSEWDRDGQYYHYLTKWIHALHRMADETGDADYHRWAVELAVVAYRAFMRGATFGSPKRMVWKMSIDLSRPLVPSMGQHDPIDGLITCLELQTDREFESKDHLALNTTIDELGTLCVTGNWITDDTLGIGGMLDSASRLVQLVRNRDVERRGVLQKLLNDASICMSLIPESQFLNTPAERRLAFRELGLSIGIHGLDAVKDIVRPDRAISAMVMNLLDARFVAEQIETFWSNQTNRNNRAWTDHRDINTVMLATSLAPDGYWPI